MVLWRRRVVLVAYAAIAMALLTGCRSHERRERIVIEETHEGEVVEEAPGEMVP